MENVEEVFDPKTFVSPGLQGSHKTMTFFSFLQRANSSAGAPAGIAIGSIIMHGK
jgi:hypothetical protein